MHLVYGRLLSLTIVLMMLSCQQQSKNEVQQTDMNPEYMQWQKIADKLLKQAQLHEGERVLLVGQSGQFDPLIPLLKNGIESAHAIYLGTTSVDGTQPPSRNTDFISDMRGMEKEKMSFYLNSVDLGIMLPGATPTDKVYASLQEVLKGGKGRTIHFHWAGAYDLSGKLLSTDSAIDVFYQNVLLKTDYIALAEKQKEFDQAMRGKLIQVTTPAGTDIKFKIGDRQVTKQDGDASLNHMTDARTLIDREVELPAGAIRVAPIEKSVEGVIAFPDSEWQGKMVKGLKMTIKAGTVTGTKALENIEAVQQEMHQAGDAGKSFREFALGFNPMLAIPQENPWIPYYGYGAGVVRLSLGDNSELGGNVKGGYVRWNFFTDATVKVGDEVWVENGKLIK